ncbi:MAG: hypothetical protein FIB01_00575 [Gemmatimonadetes bacterium]|nr:hypothetical protein [Gemmatimonadota bacterium]
MRAMLLLVIGFAACAGTGSTPGPEPERESVRIVGAGGAVQMTTYHNEGWVTHELPASLAAVWSVLPAVYDSLAIPVTSRNAASHTIGNGGLRARARLGKVGLQRYLDCGSTQGGPNAETYEIHLTISTQVLPGAGDETGSRLSTSLQAEARPVNFTADWVRCTSKNTLEKAVAELAGRLAAGR